MDSVETAYCWLSVYELRVQMYLLGAASRLVSHRIAIGFARSHFNFQRQHRLTLEFSGSEAIDRMHRNPICSVGVT